MSNEGKPQKDFIPFRFPLVKLHKNTKFFFVCNQWCLIKEKKNLQNFRDVYLIIKFDEKQKEKKKGKTDLQEEKTIKLGNKPKI